MPGPGKGLCVSLQPNRSSGVDVETVTAGLLALAPGYVYAGDDNGPCLHVNFEPTDVSVLWPQVRGLVGSDPAVAECAIVVCQGDHGRDDYLLLHHFDPTQPLDTL